jgi:DNA-binding transcriptional MerR regulator
MMERLRSTGMSIAQLREYTDLVKQGKARLCERRALLAAHRDRVEENIAKWTEALQLIDAKIDYYGEWIANGHRPQVTPPQRVRQAKQGLKKRAGAQTKNGKADA